MAKNKLTDKEIIEGLKKYSTIMCSNCKVTKTICCNHCIVEIQRQALDLINRLETENENYSHNIKQLTESNMKALAEVKRARENNKAIMQTIADVHTEAIKEFAEMLKEDFRNSTLWGLVSFDRIGNLVKEIVGEDK